MTRRLRQLQEERGQTLVFMVVLVTGFVLMVALVVDVGMWLQAQRKVQSVVDAAALAGVQELPFDQARAGSDARTYAQLNSSTISLDNVSFPSSDSIDVRASADVPGFFSSLAGVIGVTVRARAAARIGPAQTLDNVALARAGTAIISPLVVNQSSTRCLPGCLGDDRTFLFDDADHLGSELGVMCPGGCPSGGRGRNQLRDWITCRPCLPGTYGPGSGGTTDVEAAPTSATDGGQVRGALQGRVGDTLIVPVFDDADPNSYHLAGFAALVITDVSWRNDSASCRPACKSVTGHFTTYAAPGALATTDTGSDFYGVSVIGLTT
jgi:Flp pilus assembly protein TadG